LHERKKEKRKETYCGWHTDRITKLKKNCDVILIQSNLHG
jgi:hypothetical protein